MYILGAKYTQLQMTVVTNFSIYLNTELNLNHASGFQGFEIKSQTTSKHDKALR